MFKLQSAQTFGNKILTASKIRSPGLSFTIFRDTLISSYKTVKNKTYLAIDKFGALNLEIGLLI